MDNCPTLLKGARATLDPWDGCCWVEDGELVINLAWAEPCALVEYITRCTVHEVVEHILGLGHPVASVAEKLALEGLRY